MFLVVLSALSNILNILVNLRGGTKKESEAERKNVCRWEKEYKIDNQIPNGDRQGRRRKEEDER